MDINTHSTVATHASPSASPSGMGRRPPPLSSEQKESLAGILDQFDAQSATDSDLDSLNAALRTAGIPASRELRETLEARGFDVDALAARARESGMLPERRREAGLSPLDSTDVEAVSQIYARYVSQFDAVGALSDKSRQELVSALNEAGYGKLFDPLAGDRFAPGTLIDLSA